MVIQKTKCQDLLNTVFFKMKKKTLGQQIKEAKKIVASWSKEKRDSVQLEGTSMYLRQYHLDQQEL